MATKKKATKEVKNVTPEVVEEEPVTEVKEEPKEETKVIGSLKGGKQVHQGGFLKTKAVR